MYLEADTRHDVTHDYTATCTGAAETSWQAEQTGCPSVSANIHTFLSISLILFIFGLYFSHSSKRKKDLAIREDGLGSV